MYLIFDATGVGSPRNWKASSDDVFNWPRIIHLSWILLDEDLKPIEDFDCIVKPNGFEYTDEMANAHGLELDKVMNEGEPIKEILSKFSTTLEKAKYVFTHNLKFNESVVNVEFIRASMKHKLMYADSYCLMHEGTYYCQIPKRGGGFKWPSLQELHTKIFNQGYTPVNNARADVIAASRCFVALKKAKAFDDIFEDD